MMRVHIKIRKELDSNTSLYSSMTDQQVANELNAPNKSKPISSFLGSTLFGLTDIAEYKKLSSANKQQWLSMCGMGSMSRRGLPLINTVFAAKTITWANIQAASTTNVTRASEIGIHENVRVGHITTARSL